MYLSYRRVNGKNFLDVFRGLATLPQLQTTEPRRIYREEGVAFGIEGWL